MLAGGAGQHVVGFLIFLIDIFLEVQDKMYSLILYLIGYIAYGLHLWYNIYFAKGNLPTTYSLTSWLRQQSVACC